MTTVAPVIGDFNPMSREYYLDPQAAVQPLLRDTPVFYHERFDAYYILPYAECREAIADSDTFASHAYKSVPVREDLRDRIPEEWEAAGNVIQGNSPINLDPPAHTPQRRAIQKAFTHKRVANVKPEIEAIANELIDGFIDKGSCDLMHDFAAPLTLQVSTGLMNVPEEMVPGFHDWVINILGILAPIDMKPEDVTTPDYQLVETYRRIYMAYQTYMDFIEGRRENPGDDLCTALITATDDDGKPILTTPQVLSHMVAMTAAGTDTTANLIVNMVRYFTESPDQLELVRKQPELWDNAVQEGFRRASISNQLFRICTRDAEVCGVMIPARSSVALLLAAANADPKKFPDPLRFDVTRANAAEHLALGRGRHYCVGAPLAAPETRIAVEALYRRLPELKADLEQEIEFVPALSVRGFIGQDVSWTA